MKRMGMRLVDKANGYARGDRLSFGVSGLAMTGDGVRTATELDYLNGNTTLGHFVHLRYWRFAVDVLVEQKVLTTLMLY